MKSMLTEFVASAIALRTDPDTGKRIREVFLSRASNVFIQCANWDIGGAAPAPILSRYIRVELQRPSTKEAAADVQGQLRPRSVEDPSVICEIARQLYIMHGMYLKVERMISAGGIADVQKDMAIYQQMEAERYLKEELGVPPGNVTARKAQQVLHLNPKRLTGDQVLLMAREECMFEAFGRMLFMREGREWLKKRDLKTPFCWEAILGFIAPKLKIQKHHLAHAFTLLGFQIVSQVDTDAMTALAILARAQDPRHDALTVVESEFPGGDPQLARQLGLFGATAATAGPIIAGVGPGPNVPDYAWVLLKVKDEQTLISMLVELIYDKVKIRPIDNQIKGILRAKRDLLTDTRYYKRVEVGHDWKIVPVRNAQGAFEYRRCHAIMHGWEKPSGAQKVGHPSRQSFLIVPRSPATGLR